MQKKLTITIDAAVYYRLYSVIGECKISKFIEQLVKPYVINEELGAAYKAMTDQIMTVSKLRLKSKINVISNEDIQLLKYALKLQLSL
ncbi:type II toxin-antitoxin system PemK/MazF family toxin [Rickettsia gravesii]|uniref:type II toxin-antitoxin system PemK/MazF family toxin n=1 Tax=Rickettsia gravesii TaxID=354585 RepID=UPI0004B9F4E5|nr:type II toxin-antitoxin system PemK/MazF family toxin [Rickettsia gravesii]